MRKNQTRNILALGISLLFFIGAFTPCSQSMVTQMQQKPISNNQQIDQSTDYGTLTCYAFGVPGNKKQECVLSTNEATQIFEHLKALNTEMTLNPYSQKTQDLKNAFVELLDTNGLISTKTSKESYLSMLNPTWIERLPNKKTHFSFPQPIGSAAITTLCSVGGEGSGVLFPLFLLPRPRIAMIWFGDGLSQAANMITSRGYFAEGVQSGLSFGFMGIGLSYTIPGYSFFGFIGYALLVTTSAEYIEHYPPNQAPEISDITPPDRAKNIPVTLSELQFHISDGDGDLMSYTITTDPDIGSASGVLKPSGTYTVPISGLKNNSFYTWTVKVSDRKETITQQFSFKTPEEPFNPFDVGWSYRKQITVDHAQVGGTLQGFTVLVRTVDADLSAKALSDGDDILFMDGSGDAHKLFHEIESYDSSTGTLIAWVNIPILSSTEDTTFFMYYGNSEAGNQQNPIDAWDSNHLAVWHLKEPSGVIHDSTEQVIGGTIVGAQSVPGKIGKALEITNTDYISGIPSSYDDSITSALTLSAWVKWNGIEVSYPSSLIFDGRSDIGDHYFVMYINPTTHKLNFRLTKTGTLAESVLSIPHDGSWTYLVAVFNDTSDTMRVYVNGMQDNTTAASDTYHKSNGGPWIGNNHWAPNDGQWAPLNGVVDELRLSKTERSAAWLATEYKNQNSASGFLTIGPEEPGP